MGMLALSAIVKWSSRRPLTNCASIWFLTPGRKADLLLCVKACETIESGERSLTPSKIKSMSGSLFSSVAQVSKTNSVETLAAWGCCLNSEKEPAWIGKLSPHSAGSGVLKTGSIPHLTTWSWKLLLVLWSKYHSGEDLQLSIGLVFGSWAVPDWCCHCGWAPKQCGLMQTWSYLQEETKRQPLRRW